MSTDQALAAHQSGGLEEAESPYQRMLAADARDFVQCLQNYGKILYSLGRYEDAAEIFRRAVNRRPDFFPALLPLVELLLAQGWVGQALDHARRGLAANETPETKSLVGLCLCSPLVEPGMGDLRGLLLRALSEPWADPRDLAATCTRFLVLNETIRKGIARAARAWPNLGGARQPVRAARPRAIRRGPPVAGTARMLSALRG
jgi:tetratricopeptide (TPR) repeat protein